MARVAYQSLKATEPTTRDLHPYGFMLHEFRAAWSPTRPSTARYRTYKVNRIEDVQQTKKPFKRRANFDIRKYLAGSFGVHSGSGEWIDVRVRFDDVVARYVSETCWHPSQRIVPQGDGGLITEFRLSSTEELRTWLLGFGSHATVLEPEGLRAAMREELTRALELLFGSERETGQCEAPRGHLPDTTNGFPQIIIKMHKNHNPEGGVPNDVPCNYKY